MKDKNGKEVVKTKEEWDSFYAGIRYAVNAANNTLDTESKITAAGVTYDGYPCFANFENRDGGEISRTEANQAMGKTLEADYREKKGEKEKNDNQNKFNMEKLE